jgi:hypothetical protein
VCAKDRGESSPSGATHQIHADPGDDTRPVALHTASTSRIPTWGSSFMMEDSSAIAVCKTDSALGRARFSCLDFTLHAVKDRKQTRR